MSSEKIDSDKSPSTVVQRLRASVRAFLEEQLSRGHFMPTVDSWMTGFSAEFSRELGRRGWLGLTWPRVYGGHERSAVERFCVMEELLNAGAPVAAHWVGDRQVGPALLRHGTREQRSLYLPRMAAGELYFCLGLSEPDTGSDLASVRTSARVTADGSWRITGRKVWTSAAHRKHYMLALCRTSEADDRHEGLSQFIIDLSAPGVSIRPILLLSGEHHFNEVILDDVIVPHEAMLGEAGAGWRQVTTELADERSGPERFMSTVPLLHEYSATVARTGVGLDQLGLMAARLWSVRSLSLHIAGLVDKGVTPSLEAAVAKDVGTRFEQDSVEQIRLALGRESGGHVQRLVDKAVLHAPASSLRGGTTEILRSIISKRVGV